MSAMVVAVVVYIRTQVVVFVLRSIAASRPNVRIMKVQYRMTAFAVSHGAQNTKRLMVEFMVGSAIIVYHKKRLYRCASLRHTGHLLPKILHGLAKYAQR
jgi:hypothetical protein